MRRLSFLITLIVSAFLVIVLPGYAQNFDRCLNAHLSENYSDSERCFQRLVNQNPSDARSHYYLAQGLRKHGVQIGDEQRLHRAIKHYREAVRIDKNYAWAWNGLGNVLHMLAWNSTDSDEEKEYLEESTKAYRTVLKVPNQDGPPTQAHVIAHENLAMSLNEKGKFREALDEVQQALRLDSRHDGGYEVWGDILYKMSSLDLETGQRDLRAPAQRRLQTAIEKYREAVRLNSGNTEAYIGMGSSFMLLGQYQEASRQFRSAEQQGASDSAYLYNRWGNALEALGDLDGAINKYRTATQVKSLRAKSSIAFAYVNWGNALAEQTRTTSGRNRELKWAEAIQRFQQALEHPSDLKELDNLDQPSIHSVALNNMGLIYWQQENLEVARQKFNDASAISPASRASRRNEEEVYRQILLKTTQPIPLASSPFSPINQQTSTKRSIVRILSRFWTQGGTEEGTGWIVNRLGSKTLIVTNDHVVAKGRQADQIEIELYYGDVPEGVLLPRVPARIVQRAQSREDLDLALVEIESSDLPDDVRRLGIADKAIQPGESISVVGNSNFQWVNASLNKISNTDLILTPRLEPGYSGSPVLDSQNRVAGLVYARDRLASQSFTYAHPLNLIISELQKWTGKLS